VHLWWSHVWLQDELLLGHASGELEGWGGRALLPTQQGSEQAVDALRRQRGS
jgi:hypothetical protein